MIETHKVPFSWNLCSCMSSQHTDTLKSRPRISSLPSNKNLLRTYIVPAQGLCDPCQNSRVYSLFSLLSPNDFSQAVDSILSFRELQFFLSTVASQLGKNLFSFLSPLCCPPISLDATRDIYRYFFSFQFFYYSQSQSCQQGNWISGLQGVTIWRFTFYHGSPI